MNKIQLIRVRKRHSAFPCIPSASVCRPKPAWAVTAARTWTTIAVGGQEAGAMTSCPGPWVARSKGDDYLGTFLTQRAARRAIEVLG
jgi:hypothetical protein